MEDLGRRCVLLPQSICGRPVRRKRFLEGWRSRMLPSVRPLMQHQRLRARMGVRGPDPYHPRRAQSTVVCTGLPIPSRRLLRHTFLRPTTSPTTSGLPWLTPQLQPELCNPLASSGPPSARRLVGEWDCDQHTRLSGHHLLKPRTCGRTTFACLQDDCATADDDQTPQRSFAHLSDRS